MVVVDICCGDRVSTASSLSLGCRGDSALFGMDNGQEQNCAGANTMFRRRTHHFINLFKVVIGKGTNMCPQSLGSYQIFGLWSPFRLAQNPVIQAVSQVEKGRYIMLYREVHFQSIHASPGAGNICRVIRASLPPILRLAKPGCAWSPLLPRG